MCLAGASDAVGVATEGMMNGGIRREPDVLKAIALGAASVVGGSPSVYVAEIGGEIGFSHSIKVLSTEIGRNIGFLGRASLRELSPN
jgi:isopentenyl diphosphate isomerase/L-lactate dehydrogenase-like FMN-dependent dehydrogenase